MTCGCSRERCRMDPDDHRHGTNNGYRNLYCGCEPCRAANARYCYAKKRERKARTIPDHAHGVNGYGNWCCRCNRCTAAWAVDALARYHRRMDGKTDVEMGLCPGPSRRD